MREKDGRRQGLRVAYNRIAWEKGKRAEEKVSQILEEISSLDSPAWLRGCRKAGQKDESRGIDFWFDTEDVGAIAIQVKSSKTGVQRALEKHPNVPVVCIPPGLSLAEVRERCFLVVSRQRNLYLKKRQR